MPGMKRIKQIIEALKILSDTPSVVVAEAWRSVSNVMVHDVRPDNPRLSEAWNIVNKIMEAVVGLAEDMEKPAKAPETN